MRVIFFPLEPLEERYSADWFKWFHTAFKEEEVEVITIAPAPLSDKIREGSFLDVCGTNYYKAQQIAEFSSLAFNKVIKDDDVVFLMDAWFPIEQIAYIRDALKLKFKIMGIFHAGTYDPFDYLTKSGMQYWGKSLEESWFRILDKVFVATNFHKRLITSTRDVDPKKIIVTGIPACLDWDDDEEYRKENIVVFPHRLDSEKNPDMFDMLEQELRYAAPDHKWIFYRTKDMTKTKQEYYDLLKRAKISVSFADQETYGIAMVESVMSGCIPIVPNRLSYTEMYDPLFTYSSFYEALWLCKTLITKQSLYIRLKGDASINRAQLLEAARQAIPNMIKEMRG